MSCGVHWLTVSIASSLYSLYRQQTRKTPVPPSIQQHTSKANWKCPGCGKASHPGKTNARTDCPAWGKRCNSCNKTDHFASVCRKVSKVALVEESTRKLDHQAKAWLARQWLETRFFRKAQQIKTSCDRQRQISAANH